MLCYLLLEEKFEGDKFQTTSLSYLHGQSRVSMRGRQQDHPKNLRTTGNSSNTVYMPLAIFYLGM